MKTLERYELSTLAGIIGLDLNPNQALQCAVKSEQLGDMVSANVFFRYAELKEKEGKGE